MPSGPRPRPPNFTCHVDVISGVGSYEFSNGFWFKVDTTDTPTLSELASFATDVGTIWGADVGTWMTTNAAVLQAKAVFWGAGSDTIDAIATASVDGTQDPPDLPLNVAMCISWPIAAHYRGGHPRSYVGGLPTIAMNDQRTWDSSFRDNVVDGATSFIADVEELTLASHAVELGIVSFVDANAWRSPPVFRHFTGTPVIDARIDSQRRRLGPDV